MTVISMEGTSSLHSSTLFLEFFLQKLSKPGRISFILLQKLDMVSNGLLFDCNDSADYTSYENPFNSCLLLFICLTNTKSSVCS